MGEPIQRNHAKRSLFHDLEEKQNCQRVSYSCPWMHTDIYGGQLSLSPFMHAPFTQTHTPLSRLQAESTVVNIHEIVIINVTKVILFLLQERLVLIPRNWSTVREMAALRQPSWSNSVHFTFEIEIIWRGILNHTHPIIKFNRQRFPTSVQRTTSLGTQFLESGRSIHWLLHSFLRSKTKQNI